MNLPERLSLSSTMSDSRPPSSSHLPSTPPRSANPTGSSELLSPTLAKFSQLNVKDTPVHGLHNSAANPAAQTTEESRSNAAYEMETNRIKLPYEDYMKLVQSERDAPNGESSLQELPEDFELPVWATEMLNNGKTFGKGEKKLYPLLVRRRCLPVVSCTHAHPIVRDHTGRHRPRERACGREVGSAPDPRHCGIVCERRP